MAAWCQLHYISCAFCTHFPPVVVLRRLKVIIADYICLLSVCVAICVFLFQKCLCFFVWYVCLCLSFLLYGFIFFSKWWIFSHLAYFGFFCFSVLQ